MVSESYATEDYVRVIQILRKSILLMFILGTGFSAILLSFF